MIGLVELYASILALRFWRKHLEGRRIILFIDSWPALDSLVKGDSSVRLWRELLLANVPLGSPRPFQIQCGGSSQHSKMADPPGRGSLSELASWELAVERPVCPLCKKELASLV